MTPLLSVIIPAYNAELFIAESVQSVLAQGHDSLELIVVDDGSDDSTTDILEQFGDVLTLIRQPHSGLPAAARNQGLVVAQGSLIIFLDADDFWPPDRLALQLPLMKDPAIEIALGHTQRFQGDRFLEPELSMKLTASLIRREVFDHVGTFDTSLRICDDWDWFMRSREMGVGIRVHEEVTIFYRRHDRNLTLNEEQANREFMIVLKRSLDRRRQMGNREADSMIQLSQFTNPY